MSYPQYTQEPSIPPGDGSSSMKENAAEAAGRSKQAAGEVAQSATERAGEVKDEAVRQARDLIGEARGQVSRQAGRQHEALVSNLRSLSSELGSMTTRSTEPGVATELASQAQQRASGLADWLESREPGQLLDEVRDFARRRPGVFLGGALVAGLIAGRLARGAVEVHTGDDSGAERAESGNGVPVAVPAPAVTPQVGPYTTPEPTTDPYASPTYSTPEASTQAYPTSGSWQ